MKLMSAVVTVLFTATLGIALNSFTKPGVAQPRPYDDGKALFTTHCSACHMLPSPSDLTKTIWQSHVLPVMASRMGIIYPGYNPLRGLSDEEKDVVNKAGIIPNKAVLSDDDWQKLQAYVISNAPDTVIADTGRLVRNLPLKQFAAAQIAINPQAASLITSLKYNAETKTLWIGDFYNKVYNWSYSKGVTGTMRTSSPVVDFNFYNGTTYLTEVGKLFPTELSTGAYASANDNKTALLIPGLHRPVSSRIADLDGDGIPEVVVCNFGNKTGSLSIFKKNRAGKYKEKVLLQQPGASKCYVRDMDGDGKKDIIAQFSQGDESVYIFYNKGGLDFKGERVLRFPPQYGTTDMVLTDYNKDGFADIVTAHGDNADYSAILKAYHGIRLFLNSGSNKFTQKFFYPVYGATKVLAEDFDKDGDVDFAISSFFPDLSILPDEAFIYLENTNSNAFTFRSYTLKSDIPLKTLALEKADIDGDGDMDIIAGHFAQSPGYVLPAYDKKWKAAPYGLTLFLNQLKQPQAK